MGERDMLGYVRRADSQWTVGIRGEARKQEIGPPTDTSRVYE